MLRQLLRYRPLTSLDRRAGRVRVLSLTRSADPGRPQALKVNNDLEA